CTKQAYRPAQAPSLQLRIASFRTIPRPCSSHRAVSRVLHLPVHYLFLSKAAAAAGAHNFRNAVSGWSLRSTQKRASRNSHPLCFRKRNDSPMSAPGPNPAYPLRTGFASSPADWPSAARRTLPCPQCLPALKPCDHRAREENRSSRLLLPAPECIRHGTPAFSPRKIFEEIPAPGLPAHFPPHAPRVCPPPAALPSFAPARCFPV